MKAQEFYDENLENYTLLNKIDPMTAKQAMQMMVEYHQAKLKLLGLANVVGRSEQFKCQREVQGENKCLKQCVQCDLAYRNYSI